MIPPSPWKKKGEALVLLYRFPREFVEKAGFLPKHLEGSFLGGTGAVMFVSYDSSDVGPYHELLFVPGRFSFQGQSYFSVTKIYASTELAARGGRENWGLPEEVASFCCERNGHDERVVVSIEGRTIADLQFDAGRLGLPVTTEVVPPSRRKLVQFMAGEHYVLTPDGRGSLRRARLLEAAVDGAFFPDFSRFEPRMSVKAVGLNLSFPQALVVPEAE